MKRYRKIAILLSLVVALVVANTTAVRAQNLVANSYFNIDWQFNIPLGSDFAQQASGWGMNFEGGCTIAPNFSLGLFLAYHTNNKYIDRQTIETAAGSAVTTDQQHSLFQLPFGVSSRYALPSYSGVFYPYVGLKLGTAYSEMTSYYNVFEDSASRWGFYLSPEIGATIYPVSPQQFGIHVALYYSYSTNSADVMGYTQNSLNNLGFRLGLAF